MIFLSSFDACPAQFGCVGSGCRGVRRGKNAGTWAGWWRRRRLILPHFAPPIPAGRSAQLRQWQQVCFHTPPAREPDRPRQWSGTGRRRRRQQQPEDQTAGVWPGTGRQVRLAPRRLLACCAPAAAAVADSSAAAAPPAAAAAVAAVGGWLGVAVRGHRRTRKRNSK